MVRPTLTPVAPSAGMIDIVGGSSDVGSPFVLKLNECASAILTPSALDAVLETKTVYVVPGLKPEGWENSSLFTSTRALPATGGEMTNASAVVTGSIARSKITCTLAPSATSFAF